MQYYYMHVGYTMSIITLFGMIPEQPLVHTYRVQHLHCAAISSIIIFHASLMSIRKKQAVFYTSTCTVHVNWHTQMSHATCTCTCTVLNQCDLKEAIGMCFCSNNGYSFPEYQSWHTHRCGCMALKLRISKEQIIAQVCRKSVTSKKASFTLLN